MGVAAVPGSGKTETLSQLAAQIINSGVLDSRQEVLIVTLVNSAVDSFYQRVSKLVKAQGLLPHVGYRVRTLHGLAHDIVRERPALVGLADDFQIVDERAAERGAGRGGRGLAAQPSLRTGGLPFRPRSSPASRTGCAATRCSSWSRARAKAASRAWPRICSLRRRPCASGWLASDGALPLAEMGAAIYADYQRALAYRGAVDFDDLIRLALQALESDEALLLRLRQRWPFILEDEAQDSSRLQERILRTLAGPEGNWVRVGDPNQAIFETFTTASPEHLRRFLVEEGVAARDLPNSGRSTQSIIDLANHLIDWTNHEHPEPAVRNALAPPYIQPTPPGDPQPNPPDDPSAVFLMPTKFSPEGEMRAVVEVAGALAAQTTRRPRWQCWRRATSAASSWSMRCASARSPVVDSLLRSTLTTRQAAGALANLLLYLAEPDGAGQAGPGLRGVAARVCARIKEAWREVQDTGKLLRRIERVEDFVWPRAGRDWLAEAEIDEDLRSHLEAFRALVQRWQGAVSLPIDQAILDPGPGPVQRAGRPGPGPQAGRQLAADRRAASRLAAAGAGQRADDHRAQRAPLSGLQRGGQRLRPEQIRGPGGGGDHAQGQGAGVGPGLPDVGQQLRLPLRPALRPVHRREVVHPAGRQVQTGGPLNLQAEALAQLDCWREQDDPAGYVEGEASRLARLDYVRERLRLLYVGITRARKELVITWNTGRPGIESSRIDPGAAVCGAASVSGSAKRE